MSFDLQNQKDEISFRQNNINLLKKSLINASAEQKREIEGKIQEERNACYEVCAAYIHYKLKNLAFNSKIEFSELVSTAYELFITKYLDRYEPSRSSISVFFQQTKFFEEVFSIASNESGLTSYQLRLVSNIAYGYKICEEKGIPANPENIRANLRTPLSNAVCTLAMELFYRTEKIKLIPSDEIECFCDSDISQSPEEIFFKHQESIQYKQALSEVEKQLSYEQNYIVKAKQSGLTFYDIAEAIGLEYTKTTRIYKKALDQIRNYLKVYDLDPSIIDLYM